MSDCFTVRVSQKNVLIALVRAGNAVNIDQRLIVRHRLKLAAGSTNGEPAKPIVYYVDGGAPADVRQALIG